jgi:hypothetical protein
VGVKAGGDQQQRSAGKTQRGIEVRRLPNVVKRDLDRRPEPQARQHRGCEPSTGAPSTPPFDRFEENVAANGDGGDGDQCEGQRERDVYPVESHVGLEKVGQLAQCEQRRPGEREKYGERRGPIRRQAHRRARWIGDLDEKRRPA